MTSRSVQYGGRAGSVVAALSSRSTSRYREAHQAAVEAHAAAILASDGRIDVSFNAISHGEVQAPP